jgi:hypothetical protein
MSELFVLERKLEQATRTLNAKCDLLIAKLDQIASTGKPGLSQADFARLVRVTPRTVCRWVRAKKIRLQKGRVPNEEVSRFLN